VKTDDAKDELRRKHEVTRNAVPKRKVSALKDAERWVIDKFSEPHTLERKNPRGSALLV
jgi:hypothetical protein